MPVSEDWKKAAIAITPGFETAGDPYEGVSGDFDRMGISCGALQWNIGKGSLQPIVKRIGKATVAAFMPTLGADMWLACTSPINQGLAIVRGWQTTKKKLSPTARKELMALMGSPEGRQSQDVRIAEVAEVAFQRAQSWQASGGRAPTKRSFCWFFDLVTQNGGLEGLTPADVKAFITLNRPERSDDYVCDFLASVTGTSGHVRDANNNGAAWRGAEGEKLDLLVMSFLRSRTANPEWQHVVLNRKGTIAMGRGWVNRKDQDLSVHGL